MRFSHIATRRHSLRRSVLLSLCVLQGAIAYFLLFLERDYPVSKLGKRHDPPLAVRDPSILPNYPQDARAAYWSVPADEALDAEQLKNGIQMAGRYLCSKCDETGKFVYKTNLVPEIQHDPMYNVLRHAGTIYSLTQFYAWSSNNETLDTLRRSTDFLKSTCIGPVPERPDLLAVWSRPELTHGDHPLKAKLGGAGLGLVALASFEQIQPGSTPLADLRKLGNFVLYMQKPDGSFYSRYIPSSGGRSDEWTSLYYPGEAALGLVMLYEIDPDPRWLKAAARAISFLARSREGKSRVEADHWALLATARLLPVLDRSDASLTKELAVAHARQICDSILHEQQLSRGAGQAYGGFAADGRVCPTATRLEGLQAALTILDDRDHELGDRLEKSTRSGILLLLRAQVQSGENAGAVPRAVAQLPKGHRYYSSSFNRRATEVRIDYVQHWLSAMLAFHARHHRRPELRATAPESITEFTHENN